MNARLALLFLLLSATVSAAQQNPQPAPPNVAATVNGEIIRLDQVDSKVRQRPTGTVPLSTSQLRRLRLAILYDLIDDVLLKQFLAQHAPPVESAEIEKHIQALILALKKQGKTPADYLRETGQTEPQLRESWTTMLRFEKFAQSRATDAELRKYFAASREMFDGSEVRVSQIVLRVPTTATPGERAAARQKIAAIQAELVSGKTSFAEAAKKYSEDPTGKRGGDLGSITRRDTIVDEPLAKAAFALKVGELGEPVETEFGLHLLVVMDRKQGQAVTYEKVVDAVRDCYIDDLRQNLISHLRSKVPIQIAIQ